MDLFVTLLHWTVLALLCHKIKGACIPSYYYNQHNSPILHKCTHHSEKSDVATHPSYHSCHVSNGTSTGPCVGVCGNQRTIVSKEREPCKCDSYHAHHQKETLHQNKQCHHIQERPTSHTIHNSSLCQHQCTCLHTGQSQGEHSTPYQSRQNKCMNHTQYVLPCGCTTHNQTGRNAAQTTPTTTQAPTNNTTTQAPTNNTTTESPNQNSTTQNPSQENSTTPPDISPKMGLEPWCFPVHPKPGYINFK